jgi:hypothetical protein
MAKKIVRLTESDMIRLVKKVIKEQYDDRDLVINPTYTVLIRGKSSRQVKRLISNLKENISFLAILDCEYADFSDINLCEYPKLVGVRLAGTPNNLEETQDNCYEKIMESLYMFNHGN